MSPKSSSGNQRFADPQSAQVYPLPCAEDLAWEANGEDAVCRIHIDQVPAESIIVPTLSVIGTHDYTYTASLHHQGHAWGLPAVPTGTGQTAPQATGPEPPATVSTHVDCFHVHEALSSLTVELRVRCGGIPARYLANVAWRPLQLEAPAGPSTSVCCTPPPAISQISQGGGVGSRICSPACLTMVMRGFDADVDLLRVADECYDPATKLYGVWPNAIRQAARRGFLGTTEAFASWADAERVLAAGHPLIASIRFAAGMLPGAPMQSTGGHLVVVHGASPECVVANDPAAPTVATVPRTYEADAFTQAWLSHRGAAYILLP